MTTKSDEERIDRALYVYRTNLLSAHNLKSLHEMRLVTQEAKVALQAMLTEARIDGIQTGIKRSTGGYGWAKPIRSVRTSNTAFKAYAVKFFNSKMKERREALLLQLKNERGSNQR